MNPATTRLLAQLASSRPARRGLGLVVALNVFLVFMVLAVPVVVTVVILAAIDSSVQAIERVQGCESVHAGEVASVGDLNGEQMAHAATIVNVARKHRIAEYGQVVAIATALQESTLHNYGGGHADSAGLFQQRPSQGWGSLAEVTDPVKASEAFFGVADHTDNTGLLDVAGWQGMNLTLAAQHVQRAAFPNAYADDEPLARQVVASLASNDTAAAMCGSPGAMSCPSTGFAAEEGLSPDGLRVLRCLRAEFAAAITGFGGVGERANNPDSDHPSGRAVDAMIADWETQAGNAAGWRIARWVKRHADELGVTYVIFDDKIWSRERADEGWRDYGHPSGASDPSARHLDHIHVSVAGNAAGGGGSGRVVLPLDETSYTLTALFGECSDLWSQCHTGLDFSASAGTPIRAVADGTVISTAWNSAYGMLTQVRGKAPGTEYWYAHQSAQYVSVGDQVSAGQQIGAVGTTGNSTGPHLHLEVRAFGVPVDPEAWLADHGVDP